MKRMECPIDKSDLVALATGNLASDQAEELRRHLANCGSCRAEAAEYQRVWGALALWADEPLPARLAHAIPAHPRASLWRALVWATAAAAAGIALWLALHTPKRVLREEAAPINSIVYDNGVTAPLLPDKWYTTSAKQNATLIFDRMSWVVLKPNSRMRLGLGAPRVLDLAKGTVNVRITGQVLHVRVPAGQVEVAGTAFTVSVRDHTDHLGIEETSSACPVFAMSYVRVEEGTVLVKSAFGPQRTLHAAQECFIPAYRERGEVSGYIVAKAEEISLTGELLSGVRLAVPKGGEADFYWSPAQGEKILDPDQKVSVRFEQREGRLWILSLKELGPDDPIGLGCRWCVESDSSAQQTSGQLSKIESKR